MSFLNYIPGVAHAKALTHLVFNDKEGAERTMETFTTKTPIISHLTAGIAKVVGDDEFAQKCWDGGNSSLNALPVVGHAKGIGHYVVGDIAGGKKAMENATSTMNTITDGIPVVGHLNGLMYYACGNVGKGNKAMEAASRNAVVTGAGVGGFLIGGPGVALAGGVGAGSAWDLVVAAATDGKEVNGVVKILDKPKDVEAFFEAGMCVLFDGMAGNCGGKIAEQMFGAVNKFEKLAFPNENAAAKKLFDDHKAGKIPKGQLKQARENIRAEMEAPVKEMAKQLGGAVAKQLGGAVAKQLGAVVLIARAKQLVDEYLAVDKISLEQYQQEGKANKPKGDINNAPVNDVNAGKYNQAVKEMAKDVGQGLAAGSNQPPQQPTDMTKSDSFDRCLVLRQRLTVLLRGIRQRMLQYTGREWSPADRQFQRESFRQIYTIVSELLSNGYSVNYIKWDDGNAANLVIASPDGSWREVIEYQVADYLDVHDQLIDQQFTPNPQSPCPTVLSARFQGSQLVLSREWENKKCRRAKNVIYGIRCRICDRKLGPGNISYVGQTTRSMHKRACGEHAREVEKLINEDSSEDALRRPWRRPMYEHAAYHFRNDLRQCTRPRDAFRLAMEVILLPIAIGDDDDLRSWECFWQFFCLCKTFFYGWSQR